MKIWRVTFGVRLCGTGYYVSAKDIYEAIEKATKLLNDTIVKGDPLYWVSKAEFIGDVREYMEKSYR